MSDRKALVVGIDHYDHIGGLTGCVNDANSVGMLLDRHADGSVNFGQPRIMLATNGSSGISRQISRKPAMRWGRVFM